jgi:glycerol-3-phosphate acyltransferase PlsY
MISPYMREEAMLMRSLFGMISAYLLGSIPFGYLLVKYVFTDRVDVRTIGSRSIGATNVSRIAGAKGGVLTGVLDIGKGMAAVLFAGKLTANDPWWMGWAAACAVAGHIFPVWIGFRGGKGVATGAGGYLLLSPLAVFSALVLWAVIVSVKRYVSLGSIFATASIPFWIWLWEGKVLRHPSPEIQPLVVTAAVTGGLIIFRHRENIRRLLAGTERKLGARLP